MWHPGLRLTVAVALSAAIASSSALAQCMLANPSFELPGSGGQIFGGWNQFGVVGTSSNATHGSVAARVTSPSSGPWGVSALWQRLDTAPGETWSATVEGWHSSSSPLTGDSQAILNIEWRDAAGMLISYESHTVADAATPPEEIVSLEVESGPAPPGTVATHFLLGVLQGPTDPAADVFYDQPTFDSLGPPTLDEIQWNDFPGGRTLSFSGRNWRVKGPGLYGPGPNLFGDTPTCTWVDTDGRLHLTIQEIDGSWYSTELALEEPLGYGDYVFTTFGRLDAWHPNVVLGLFLWQYGPCFDPANGWWNPYNEIDVELSRWGDPANGVGQFVAQPWDFPGNISRFDAAFDDDELTSHAFRWLPDRVEFRSWRGGPADEASAVMLHEWTYTGPHIPRPEQPRVHVNFWRIDDPPETTQEVVVDAFTFTPGGTAVGVPADAADAPPATRLAAARPNPFTPHTTIRFTAPSDGPVDLSVYDASGRHVRTLVNGLTVAGTHDVVWNGRDRSGRRVAAGVYFYRLEAGRIGETRRVVHLR